MNYWDFRYHNKNIVTKTSSHFEQTMRHKNCKNWVTKTDVKVANLDTPTSRE